MMVSAIVNCYSGTKVQRAYEAIESLLEQTYDDYEIILVVDDSKELQEKMANRFGRTARVAILEKPEDEGLAASRNYASKRAEGDVVAFLDADAVANRRWIEELADAYESNDIVGAGGPAYPIWPTGDPPIIVPDEFDWLVGAGPYHDSEQPVRNTYGCNFSVLRSAFLEVGGFDKKFGKQDVLLQGEETELADRVTTATGKEFWYRPEAYVLHHVTEEQLDLTSLINRAYWQGISKKYLEYESEFESEEEGNYLKVLFTKEVPNRMRQAQEGNMTGAISMTLIAFYTTATVLGYLRGDKVVDL